MVLQNEQIAQTEGLSARLMTALDRMTRKSVVLRRRASGNRYLLPVILMLAAIVSGIATYAALNEAPPFGDDPHIVIWLLNLDLVILLTLIALIARSVVGLFAGRKRGVAGAHLHIRLVWIFTFLAAVPAIVMTVFAAFFLHFGMQSWFSDRVKMAVRESQAVAEAYLEEHKQVIRADVLGMANDLNRQAAALVTNPEIFDRVINTQSLLRNFSEAIVIDSTGDIIASSSLSFTLTFETLPAYAVRQANEGEVVVMTGGNDDRVRALVKLPGMLDAYLFVGRMVDPTVLSHVIDTRRAAESYAVLEAQRKDLQITITLIFVVVAFLIMLAAVWFGLAFARQLVMPIGSLIAAADRVRAGDLTARVQNFGRGDEIEVLGRAFNRMTSQIQQQQNELVAANRQLDQRRRFTETILAGVSAGIVGVDQDGRITLANNSAAALFADDVHTLIGRLLPEIIPDAAPLLEQAFARPNRIAQAEIPWQGADGGKRIFLVRIVVELVGDSEQGAVLTFDDITELQSAQRKAAWADVARRIAHEIKNPLTPIQLSAERLKRKYLKQITEDPDVFAKCTDTIIHHVGDIGRMVNEFSAFARMPEPVMQRENLVRHIRDMLVLQQQAHADITLNFNSDEDEIHAHVDIQQIRQALTNITQNAIDSIHGRMDRQRREGVTPTPGAVDIRLHIRNTDGRRSLAVILSDNGLGLPKDEDLNRLAEPYVTKREKGTGLGLAIVKKIMEDHKGRLVLGAPEWFRHLDGWTDLGGATVVLLLPLDETPDKNAA